MGEIKFEDAIKKLEGIVDELESGDIPLESSLAKYEEGVKMVRVCQDKLQEARKRIEILVKTKDGKIKIEPFGEEGAPAKKTRSSKKAE